MNARMLFIPLHARLVTRAESFALAEKRYEARILRRPKSGFLTDQPQSRLPAFLRKR